MAPPNAGRTRRRRFEGEQQQQRLPWRRREPIDAGGWVRGYARRRYGPRTPPSAEAAWAVLGASVYGARDGHTDHSRDIPTSRPGLSPAEVGLWGLRPHLWYDARQVGLQRCFILGLMEARMWHGAPLDRV